MISKKTGVDFLFLDPELQPNRHKWLPMSWSRRVVSQLKLTPVVGKPWKTTSFGQISNSWPPFSLSTARNWYAWNKHLHVRRLHWKVAAEWHVSLPWIWNLLLEAHLKFVVYQRSHFFRGLNPKKWIISRIQPFGHHNYMVPCCFSRCSVRKKTSLQVFKMSCIVKRCNERKPWNVWRQSSGRHSYIRQLGETPWWLPWGTAWG